ncbi:MAG: hypothetical protein K8S94_04870, partial [Planctomycetia bacterium]|nr:hypothetical protein [Planctomycetia bacterium]
NVAEAERFVYGSGPLPALVVGSSMVESVDLLTHGKLQVLGMNGMSAREALEILVRSGRRPRRVAVELNGLIAPPNDAFLKRLFNPVMLPLRRRVLALRTEYQPASVIMSLAKGFFGRGASRGAATPHLGSVADIRIDQLRELYRNPPDMKHLRGNLVSVRDSVAVLEDRGVDVIYFEYPVPHGLSKTRFHEARRAASVEILGAKAAETVYFDEDAFRTRDGIHLDAEGQQAVADRLTQMLLGTGGEATAER